MLVAFASASTSEQRAILEVTKVRHVGAGAQ
jgi:hypothetical protein